MLLEPRSLLIFKDDAYHHYLHCIEDNRVDTLFLQVVPRGEECEIRKSNVDNLKGLALVQRIEGGEYREVEKEWGGKGEEEGVDMEVHLRRTGRVSLTMRWVEPKW